MNKIKFVCVMCLFIITVASCNDNNKSTALLQQATEIIEENPKQALVLLDSIHEPQTMDEANYMKYVVANVQAKYKNYKDVTNDTLVFEAQKYFRDKPDHNQAALAHFYTGVVNYERKETAKELQSYLLAEQSAKLANNNLLRGRILQDIAGLYRRQKLDTLAIQYYKGALDCYEYEEKSDTYILQTTRLIGISYRAINEIDSAKYYYEKGLDFSLELDDKYYQMQFNQHLGVLLRSKKEYNESVRYLNEALVLTTTKADSTRVFLNLAKLYNQKHQLDSAKYYTDFVISGLPTVTDRKVLRTIYGALEDYNTQIGNVTEAKHYSDLWHVEDKQIQEANNAAQLLEITKQHQQELQQKDRKVAESRIFLVVVILVSVTILLLIVIYIRYKKKRIAQEKEIDKNKLLEAEKESLETQAKGIMAFQDISHDAQQEWKEIDTEVTELSKELGAKTKPALYQRIEKMVEKLKNKTEEQRIQWANDYLAKRKFDEKLIKGLNSQQQLLLVLCCRGHSKQDIASILSISEKKVYPLKLELKHKMKAVEMKDREVEKILFSV